MKAIRSLEQHVDSLMSYDFTGLTEDQLIEELAVVDDRRIWKIAEAIRRDISKEYIHRITKIDRWFIDKIAILVEMEQALKTQPLTGELLLEAKRMEFPDYVIGNLCGRTEAEIKALREGYNIRAAYKMVDTCAAEFAAATPYYYSVYGGPDTENEAVSTPDKKKFLFSVQVRSVSARVLSLTSALYTVPGLLKKKATRQLLSTTILRLSAQTLTLQTSCISSL